MKTAGWLQAGGRSPIGDIRFTTLLMRTPRSGICGRATSICFEIGARSDRTDDVTIAMKPQPEPSAQEVLAGLVERVTYHNAENGFCVLRAKARGHRDIVTVVGHSATIAAGEWITASGEWVNDRTHGQQFKAKFLRTSLPDSADGIEKYLASGMIRGVGPVYAKKLVRAFGQKVFDVIEATPTGCVRSTASDQFALADSRCLGRAESSPGNYGLLAWPRCRHGAGGADLQDLWF